MALTTTTFHLVRDQMATKICALTPTGGGGRLYRRSKKSARLREWTAVKTEAGFRAFEITRADSQEPPLLDPAAYLRSETVTVTVAYPLLFGIYGTEDTDEVENLIRADAAQIRDCLYSSGNYVDGQQAALPLPIPEPDRSSDEVWFQDITFTVLYYEAQTLT